MQIDLQKLHLIESITITPPNKFCEDEHSSIEIITNSSLEIKNIPAEIYIGSEPMKLRTVSVGTIQVIYKLSVLISFTDFHL